MNLRKLWFAAVIVVVCSVAGLAQTIPDLEQGLKPYGSYHGGDLDSVSLSNGNLFFHATLMSYSQRGGELSYPLELIYNNKNFTLHQSNCLPPNNSNCRYTTVFGPPPTSAGSGVSRGAQVSVGYSGMPSVIGGGGPGINTGLSFDGSPIFIHIYSVLMPDGSTRPLVNTGSVWVSQDGSGYRYDPNSNILTDSHGTKFSSALNVPLEEDANGNQISQAATAGTDTLGRSIQVPPCCATAAGTPPASTVSLTACPVLNYNLQPVTFAYAWNLPTVNGGTLPLTLCYASVFVRTALFGSAPMDPTGTGQGLHDLAENFTMLQSVVYPDNTYWAFEYDAADPNNSASVGFGDLLRITLPTGGSLSYTWKTSVPCSDPNAGISPVGRSVVTRTVDANDGTGPHTWTYGAAVTDPLGNDTVHTFTSLGGTCTSYETQTQYYQGSQASGTLLKTVKTDYNFTSNPYDGDIVTGLATPNTVANVFPIRVTTTLPNGMVSKVETDYDTALAYHGPLDGITSNILECPLPTDPPNGCQYGDQTTNPVTNYTGSLGKVIARREYDWGNGAPGPLLRQTSYAYQWQNGTNAASYLSNNFLDLASSVTVFNGAGSQLAQTTYGYDEYALGSPGIATQHNGTPANGSFRGNQTSTHRWLNGSTVSTPNCPIAVSNNFLVNYATYNDTGTVKQTTDACGSSAGDPNHSTTFTYSSTFVGAYPTTVTNPLGQSTTASYDFNTGQVTSQTDANGQTISTGYDTLWRPSQVNRPDGGQTTFCFTDAGGATCSQGGAPFKVVISSKLNATQSETATGIVDGLARTTETQLNSNPSCSAPGSRNVTTYDALGRKATVTNPFCTTADSTYGVTSYAYDALGRNTQVIHPGGSSITTTYTGRAVQVSDEGNGTKSVQRISQSDGLGRLTSVCEVSSASQSGSGGTPASCGLDIAATGFLTSYVYDALGNLTSVSQGGFLPRSFLYNSLSQLTSATNPESGTIAYGYDADGNMVTKTDARSITTTAAYDKINRLTGKTYSDTTPAVSFVYDACPAGGCPTGVTPLLPVGRMVESFTNNARTFYSYDQVGRVKNQWQCTPVNCATGYVPLSYGYDLGGNLTSQNNGLGVTLTNGYDTASRLTSVTSNLSDANHPANLLSGVLYFAPGLLHSETMGNSVSELLGYDARMRLTSLTATSPTGTAATPGQGWVQVNGTSDASRQNPVTTATAQVSIGGTEHHYSQCTPRAGCINVYDLGKVFITVNGHEYDYNFSGSDSGKDTASTVAHGLVAAIQGDGARVVNASCSDNPCTTPVITLTSLTQGSAGNSIAVVTGDTYLSNLPQLASQGPSFTASPASTNLAGGQDASTTYDTGSVTITLNGTPFSIAYGSSSSNTSLATALAASLTQGGLVNASATGSLITIKSRTAGANTNYTLAMSSSSSAGFSPASFTATDSGAALTGGSGASPGTTYSLAMAYTPNSNVLSANDSANGNWTYSYDDFNRLTGSNKSTGQQIYSYVYDRFGNRWQQNAAPGTNQFLATFTGNNNRLDGYQYDAAGNLLVDNVGQHYAYDAESRITSVNSGAVTYTYNAVGQRVEKNVGGVKTDYLYDLTGHAIAEINASGTATREELFAGGKHLATYTNNTTYFTHGDALGTERVRTDMTGAACESIQSLPYGDGQSTSGSCGDPSTRHFTGKERDAETGLDYFGARYYGSSFGRFTSPDRPLADQKPGDPQSWNLYGYVTNNPLRYVDPTGTVKRDANGQIVFTPKGKVDKNFSNGDQHRKGKMQPGYIQADNGKKIAAYQQVGGSSNYACDCHGLTFADGKYWINNDQVPNLLKGDGYEKTKQPAPGDVAIFKANGDVVHSLTVTAVDDKGKVTEVTGLGGTEPASHSNTPEEIQQQFGKLLDTEVSIEYYHDPNPDRPVEEKLDQVKNYEKPKDEKPKDEKPNDEKH